MAKTHRKSSKQELIALLHAEDYCGGCRYGANAIATLKKLVQSTDSNLAAKATYLAGLINDDESAEVVELAAKSRKPAVRLAAASAAGHLLPGRAEPILLRLLKSRDVGIRKIALKATRQSMTDKVRRQVEIVKKQESIRDMKSLASLVLKSPVIR